MDNPIILMRNNNIVDRLEKNYGSFPDNKKGVPFSFELPFSFDCADGECWPYTLLMNQENPSYGLSMDIFNMGD